MNELACSFCGVATPHAQLAAGERVYICASCVALCREIVREEAGVGGPVLQRAKAWLKNPRCSFCGASYRDVERLIAGGVAHICDRCVDKSETIVNPPAPGGDSPDR